MSNAPADSAPSHYTWAALAVAALASLGSLYLTLGMGLFACPLCFYQRTFVLSAFAVLFIGLITGMGARVSLTTLALPLAIAGLTVALQHVRLERSRALECPAGVLGLGTSPQQSMLSLALLCIVLLLDRPVAERLGGSFFHTSLAAGLGVLLGIACILSAAQPPRDPPTAPYAEAPKICRPPYVSRE